MAIELQEKGRVRFWAQVAKFTENCQVEYVFNDTTVTQGKVCHLTFWVETTDVHTLIHGSVSALHFLLQISYVCLIRNTRWTLTRAQASLRCTWTRWRSLMKEPTPSTWSMEKRRAAPALCWLERVGWPQHPNLIDVTQHQVPQPYSGTRRPPGGSLGPCTGHLVWISQGL